MSRLAAKRRQIEQNANLPANAAWLWFDAGVILALRFQQQRCALVAFSVTPYSVGLTLALWQPANRCQTNKLSHHRRSQDDKKHFLCLKEK